MGRNRVLSFMSTLSGGNRDSRTPSPPTDAFANSNSFPSRKRDQAPSPPEPFPPVLLPSSPDRPEYGPGPLAGNDAPSATPHGRQRSSSRPLSMIQTYHPRVMDTNDTVPELQPVFTLLNSHANKLYQEGYFLKLDDQNTQGRPNPDRNWTECFAQLVGTVLSLWDAAELDAAGEDGEVLPKFINLTDASLKVIDSLPTHSSNEQPLQNILSLSTAGRNRYLLHFNSHHSLIQWTAGIRLAMFEHSTLQEAYTGALIAGKGKSVNNINLIMSRARFTTEEWVRVRFGAGVPWRRCWCVITPPDEKETQKLQKDWKKRSPYDRTHVPLLKGDIKFYDTRKEGKKQKKAKPIATVTNAYSAYAIYPQSKALIDASSLIKLEGTITIHSDPASTTEGFVFMMPEVRPAVTGFEMMLRSLFPTWDTFALYGRPTRLVASVLDPRSLMFAMPKHRRYGYLEILDVSGLVATEGSSGWTEREWRKRLKDLTAKRMAAMDESASSGFESERTSNRSSKRLSFGPGPLPTSNSAGIIGGERSTAARPRVNFADDGDSLRSSRSTALAQHPSNRTDSAPPVSERQRIPSSMAQAAAIAHARNSSDTGVESQIPYAATTMYDPTVAGGSVPGYYPGSASPSPPIRGFVSDLATTPERVSSEDEVPSRNHTPPRELRDMQQRLQTPEPVHAPPAFHHPPSSRPAATPFHSPELRRANSRLSNSTLAQIVNAGAVANGAWPMPDNQERRPGSQGNNRGGVPMPPTVMPSSASAPTLGQSNPPGLVPSNTAPHLAYSKSPLNQAHNVLTPTSEFTPQSLSHSVDGPLQATGPMPTGPLPQVPPHTGHLPSHLYDTENGRQVLLAQGPTPPNPPAPSQEISQPEPERLRTPPPNAGHAAGAPPLSPIQTSPPIQRKPVPSRADSVQRYKGSSEPQSAISSAGSLQDYYIDEAALAKVQFTEKDEPGRKDIVRKDTKQSAASSRYDDASSTTTPDYASTHESVNSQESVNRPRAGVLRTVGDAAPQPRQLKEILDIPEVNFGPTINYAAANIPRNKTPTPLPSSAGPKAFSPAPAATPSGLAKLRKSPRDQQRLSDVNHYRQDSDDTIRRRSVAWQPGGAVVGTGGGASAGEGRPGAMTPEQFVLRRAQAATPLYPHQRVPSNNSLAGMRNNTPSPAMRSTPPPAVRRTSSYDLLNSAPNPQYQQQQRPSSQGATTALGGHGRSDSIDVGSHLSAREQEHLARMTGAPLINMAANPRNSQQTSSGPGLVGAIAAREREKQQMKDGVSSQAVQYAINQRQQLQFQQQQHAQQQYYLQQQQQQQQQQQYAQMYSSPSPPAVYGGYQLPPGHGPPQPRPQMAATQNTYVPPSAYSQPAMPGGWPLMQNQQQGFSQGYPQGYAQGYPQGYPQSYGGGQQYTQSQAGGAPRARTPGSSGQGTTHPGQAL